MCLCPEPVTNQLRGFQLKLCMAISSDMMLKVADHSGHVKNKSFEMTTPQFQNFYKRFEEIAAIIETV
ncbi:unnamed protein product [Nyctereutes procyonoides]|uniref:(raccoon dog) hypothetical protein n=1 Tax=Nyctereutes procyonoides TaxID=34880 RepID=A0A811Z113_NYCPR|nr:unnamed protein product [Nyctereutes procyonoides]